MIKPRISSLNESLKILGIPLKEESNEGAYRMELIRASGVLKGVLEDESLDRVIRKTLEALMERIDKLIEERK